jgi:hypothetical protein
MATLQDLQAYLCVSYGDRLNQALGLNLFFMVLPPVLTPLCASTCLVLSPLWPPTRRSTPVRLG